MTNGYLATYDTELDLASDTSIQIPRIRDELEKSKARRKILIIDSCYSGIGVGKRLDPRMSEDFERSLFSNISEGWAIFASCKRSEVSYSLEDNSMSVFTHHLIEGLKGNADADKDSTISLQDLSLYVTKMVSKWAVEHNKIQNPNIEMQLVGTLMFTINNPDAPISRELEYSGTEKKAQSIVLTSLYVPDSWRQIADEAGPTGDYVAVSQEERKSNVIENKETFIGYLLATLINYYKPSQIKLNKIDEYELPFGKLVNTSQSPFKNEFKLEITEGFLTPTVESLLNSIDDQIKVKWDSIEYIFKGNFDFDAIVDIAKEKGYSILDYQLKQDYFYLKISQQEKRNGWVVKSKWIISFENNSQGAKMTIFQDSALEKEFFQTIPIRELIDIFSSSLRNI